VNIYDCVVIGGGLSGLAAAARLSHFGKKTLLIEKNASLGGLNTFYFKHSIEIDSGLHAMTNFSPKNGAKSLPLNKLLRQLRISYDELQLIEQIHSEIRFPSHSIVFDNSFENTAANLKKEFPDEANGIAELCKFILRYDAFSLEAPKSSARKKVSEFIKDKILTDMLFCPLSFYGSSIENDMDMNQFVIMFRSIFAEGLCRPANGIKTIIEIMSDKLRASNCEIRKKTSALKISRETGRLVISLSDGSSVETEKIISCAGANETIRLCEPPIREQVPDGQMAFVEAIFCMKEGFSLENYKNACLFFCQKNEFKYSPPETAFSLDSGVFCCPDNFHYPKDAKPKHSFLRLTLLANHQKWLNSDEKTYSKMKRELRWEAFAKIAKLSGLDISESDILFSDIFTPRTIVRWTGHSNGAIYGAIEKIKNGKTPVENLFLCGTDQGFLGITGSMLSGISIANLRALS
jgi:phytoene dehydrogenase-like protein